MQPVQYTCSKCGWSAELTGRKRCKPCHLAHNRKSKYKPDMLRALQGLYKHCSMIHKHWGEGCNQKAADEAIQAGLAAITKATQPQAVTGRGE